MRSFCDPLAFLSNAELQSNSALTEPPLIWSSLLVQAVKHLPTMQETGVQSLGQEDPLEEEMANHSTIFAWRIPWTEKEAGGIQSTGLQRVRQN